MCTVLLVSENAAFNLPSKLLISTLDKKCTHTQMYTSGDQLTYKPFFCPSPTQAAAKLTYLPILLIPMIQTRSSIVLGRKGHNNAIKAATTTAKFYTHQLQNSIHINKNFNHQSKPTEPSFIGTAGKNSACEACTGLHLHSQTRSNVIMTYTYLLGLLNWLAT